MLGSLIRFTAFSTASYGIVSALHHYSEWREAAATPTQADPEQFVDDATRPPSVDTGVTLTPAAPQTFVTN